MLRGGFANVIQELLGDINCQHLALLANRLGDQARVQAGAGAHIGHGHAGLEIEGLEHLGPLVENLTAFALETLDEFGHLGFPKLIVDPWLDALFLGRGVPCQQASYRGSKR